MHVIADATNNDWELVRSVPGSFDGTDYYVLIPEDKVRDLTNYESAASAIAGTKDTCCIFFWTDRANIPSASMTAKNMQMLTATYERHPNCETPQLRLAYWLYPNVDDACRADALFIPSWGS